MKYPFFSLITVALVYSLNIEACTWEELKALDQQLTSKQLDYYNEKYKQLDELLKKIQIQNNFTDKELLAYRFDILNTPAAKKLHDREKKLTYGDMIQIEQDRDCERMQTWSDDTTESANKQWTIVFKRIEKDLQKSSKK